MDLPSISRGVSRNRFAATQRLSGLGIVPQCDPNEDCEVCTGPRWARVCGENPICQARRLACRGDLARCVTSGMLAYGAGSGCVACVVGGAVTGQVEAAVACASLCGISAALISDVVQHCG